MAIENYSVTGVSHYNKVKELLNDCQVQERLKIHEQKAVAEAIKYLIPHVDATIEDVYEATRYKIKRYASQAYNTGVGIPQSELGDEIEGFFYSDRFKTIINWLIEKTK